MRTLQKLTTNRSLYYRFFIIISVLVLLSACKKEEIETYKVTFWSEIGIEPQAYGGINVTVDNEIVGIISISLSSEPDCGAIGSIEYTTDNPIIYWSAEAVNFEHTSQGKRYWPTSKVTLSKECTKIKVGYH